MENKWLNHVRYSIGFANVVFLFVGATLIAIGAWIVGGTLDYRGAVSTGSPYVPAIIAIIVGILAVVVSFCGCVGAFAKSRIMVMIYIGLLLLILIAQVLVITLALNFKESAEDNIKKELAITLNTYNTGNSDLDESLKRIQSNFKCCGVTTFDDWKKTSWYLNKNKDQSIITLYPQSCCKDVTSPGCAKNIERGYTRGCVNEVKKWTRSKTIILSSIAMALLVVQIFGIFFGVVLLRMTPEK